MIDDGGPAYPRNGQLGSRPTDENPYTRISDVREFNDGMSLRDWFAGQALGGFASRRDLFTVGRDASFEDLRASVNEAADSASLLAYRLADAMLLERAKGGDA